MQRLFLALVSLLPALLWACAPASRIVATNRYHKNVVVSVYYNPSHHGGWRTTCFWTIKPGQSFYLAYKKQYLTTYNTRIYVHATASDGVKWVGHNRRRTCGGKKLNYFYWDHKPKRKGGGHCGRTDYSIAFQSARKGRHLVDVEGNSTECVEETMMEGMTEEEMGSMVDDESMMLMPSCGELSMEDMCIVPTAMDALEDNIMTEEDANLGTSSALVMGSIAVAVSLLALW